MQGLKLTNLKKSYGLIEVIHGVDLEIDKGEFIVFVGPSGCGKSTLLRMIAGLESITDGKRVNETPPSLRGIAMVFQSYALYPHMTVYDNMAFSLRITKASKDEIDQRVRKAADTLQLTDYLTRLPKALSGGQRQRVAIGRAIVRNPKVFLFDEPLSNLDAALRVKTRLEIASLKENMPGTTMIYVTHDQVEAMTLADRIVVLSAGKIEQVGSPLELYTRPANLFVAQFIGSPAMNIISAKVASVRDDTTTIVLGGGNTPTLPFALSSDQVSKPVHFGIRPEDLELCDPSEAVVKGNISFIESLGEVTILYVEVEGSKEPFVAKLAGIMSLERGSDVAFKAPADKLHLFDEAGLTLRK
ncbi:ABC transporter ATP-binding protein [Leucothrix arctica]|uniref:ABC transporter ATP-binding protein n=1 Tax=Leucothrix arctica TaxID=1481894 RepID=A0A317C6Z4_9GAMM|nr:sn-glycerol-3-phosphate ABC transporter ATP-binding protein UgpC [Leucothrix arctica]PWQ93991.1 ABC transporter ATP-binding protein [Leucothrix arctica]